MSVQEAAAVGVPVIGSDKIPFVVEYLMGENPQDVQVEPESGSGDRKDGLRVGRGGIVVPSDDTDGFVQALDLLLSDEARRKTMGREARSITVPYFTWSEMTRRLLDRMGVRTDER